MPPRSLTWFSFGSALALGGCSGGESGLVLGRPLPAVVGGQAGTGSLSEAGAGAGSEGGAEAVAGGGGQAGEPLGEAGAPGVDWIDERCTPKVVYSRDATSTLFDSLVQSPATLVWSATHASCRELFRHPSEVKDLPELTLVVEDYDGIASSGPTWIRISTRWLQTQSDEGADVAAEIAGLVHFTTSIVYENDGGGTGPYWVVAGIADFVRLRAGYVDPAYEVRRSSYAYSSKTAAFFFDYLVERNPDLVYQLNQRLGPAAGAWNNDAFITFMGSDVDTLWAEYQATLP
jgi:hypothetical protein